MYIIFTIYEYIVGLNSNFNNITKKIVKCILSFFVLSVNVVLLKEKSNLFVYWMVISILISRNLLYILKKTFKYENIFSLGYLIVYATINSFLMDIFFKNIEYSTICAMNVMIAIAIFLQEKIFIKIKKYINFDYGAVEYFFIKNIYTYIMPSYIIFFLYLFDLINF
jgi:hypothetical protein